MQENCSREIESWHLTRPRLYTRLDENLDTSSSSSRFATSRFSCESSPSVALSNCWRVKPWRSINDQNVVLDEKTNKHMHTHSHTQMRLDPCTKHNDYLLQSEQEYSWSSYYLKLGVGGQPDEMPLSRSAVVDLPGHLCIQEGRDEVPALLAHPLVIPGGDILALLQETTRFEHLASRRDDGF